MRYHTIFAQAYGQGDYGECAYNTDSTQYAQCTAAAGGTNNGTSGGSLSDTGISLIFIVTLACLLIFVAILVRFWRRKPTPVAQEVEEIEDKRFAERF
jgi:hypothetical protein